ncbi:MAG: shikimate dehydrogenase, partial [Deinococcus-Thermus bacterium]|nr:shikimate dehydrogenase [Deinococcota bacterium]
RDGHLVGHAKDPVTSGLALGAFLPEDHFADSDAEVLILGAGGAAVAISVHLADLPDARRPRRMTFVDLDENRLAHLRALHDELAAGIELAFVANDDPRANDRLMEALPDGSLVVNATGMGKDRPGSPVSDEGRFPRDGYVWELNYRGELDFLTQALRQREGRGLHVEDGWVYFLHGWTHVIAEVFDRTMDAATFDRLAAIAAEARS